jgi:hypothetical protein
MPVTIRFTNGEEREVQEASTAYRRFGRLIAAHEGVELDSFELEDVLVAFIKDPAGRIVQIMPVVHPSTFTSTGRT